MVPRPNCPAALNPALVSKRRDECFQSSFRQELHIHNPQIYLMIILIWTTVIRSTSDIRMLYWLSSDFCSSLSGKTTLLIFLPLLWPLLLNLLYQFPLSSQVPNVGASSVICPGPFLIVFLHSYHRWSYSISYFFFLIYKKLFISVSVGSSLLLRLSSTCGEWGRLSSCDSQSSRCGDFFSWGAPSPEYRLNSCGGKA